MIPTVCVLCDGGGHLVSVTLPTPWLNLTEDDNMGGWNMYELGSNKARCQTTFHFFSLLLRSVCASVFIYSLFCFLICRCLVCGAQVLQMMDVDVRQVLGGIIDSLGWPKLKMVFVPSRGGSLVRGQRVDLPECNHWTFMTAGCLKVIIWRCIVP